MCEVLAKKRKKRKSGVINPEKKLSFFSKFENEVPAAIVIFSDLSFSFHVCTVFCSTLWGYWLHNSSDRANLCSIFSEQNFDMSFSAYIENTVHTSILSSVTECVWVSCHVDGNFRMTSSRMSLIFHSLLLGFNANAVALLYLIHQNCIFLKRNSFRISYRLMNNYKP